MNNIIAHIVGLDEIHKNKLIKKLPQTITVIDLDKIQHLIYNDRDIIKQKNIWSSLTREMNLYHKQQKLIGSKRTKTNFIYENIRKTNRKRDIIKKRIHKLWKTKMGSLINTKLNVNKKNNFIFIGFNIFPKDYRVRFNLPINDIYINSSIKIYNKLIFEIKPKIYAANQIKYYLHTFANKIINGTFPLNLLKIDYLANKYDKFTTFYYKLGYNFIKNDDILKMIMNLYKIFISKKDTSKVYLATLYKSSNNIPIDINRPIEGYFTRKEAINAIKKKINKPTTIYLYELNMGQFNVVNNKLIATKELKPLKEEMLFLT